MTTNQAVAVALVLTCAAVLGVGLSRGSGPDRLMPTSQAEKVALAIATDGRAINVTLTNASDVVVTGGTLRCEYEWQPSTPVPTGCFRSFKSAHTGVEPAACAAWRAVDMIGQQTEAAVQLKFERTIKPGQMTTVYGEMEKAFAVSTCQLSDARSHDSTWREIF